MFVACDMRHKFPSGSRIRGKVISPIVPAAVSAGVCVRRGAMSRWFRSSELGQIAASSETTEMGETSCVVV